MLARIKDAFSSVCLFVFILVWSFIETLGHLRPGATGEKDKNV